MGKWTTVLAIALFYSQVCTLFSQTRDQKQVVIPHAKVFEEIRSKIIALVQKKELISMAVAVAKDGEIIWEEAFGWADMENKIMANSHTIYPLGSLAKSITATGLMKLVDQNEISLEDPANKYLAPVKLKNFEGDENDATVRHVLNMAAGIPHGWSTYFNAEDVPQSESEKNGFFGRIALSVFSPGEVYEYSNNSMGIAERIIENASNRELSDFMTNEVFLPLGMKNTFVRFDISKKDDFATKYSAKNERASPAFSFPTGGFAFFSSVHDLVLYGMFHLKNHLPYQKQIISDKNLDLMHYYDDGVSKIFALGWFGDEKLLVSNGSVFGANTNLTLAPPRNLAIVCLTNKSTYLSDQISGEILEVLVPGSAKEGEKARKEYFRAYNTPYQVTPKLLGTWTGAIKTIEGDMAIKMAFNENGKIFVTLDKQEKQELQQVTFNFYNELRGKLDGYLPSWDSEKDDTQRIVLKLKLKNNRLFGYIAARFNNNKGSFSVPSYLRLNRN